MRSARGIAFEVRPSDRLTLWLVLMVGLGVGAPLFTVLPGPLRWLLAVAMALDGMRRIVRYRRPACRRVVWAADGAWTITDRHGATTDADLTAARRVGSGICLSLRWHRGHSHLLFFPDNTPMPDLRMLRARLKRVGRSSVDETS